jgi:serine/threonine protein kinase
MGEVWGARDTRLDRRVAIKFIRFPDDADGPELVRRFERESRITARLEHPGVPAVFDSGTDTGRPLVLGEPTGPWTNLALMRKGRTMQSKSHNVPLADAVFEVMDDLSTTR